MNIKRLLAIALSTTMVLGSSLTALADDVDPTTQASGSMNGTGAGVSEGNVNTTITKVIVPTEESVTEGIAFIADPQRLISSTEGAKYEGYTFPESDDTGVYFRTGAKEYSNTSNTFYVANQGTGDVTFTIKVEKVDGTVATDIPFDSKTNATDEDAAAPKLYIGAMIGVDATPVAVSATPIEKVAVLEAVSENFDYFYKNNAYTYEAKSGSKWNAVPIKFEGAITNVATDKTVPGVKLTYSWAAADEEDATTSGLEIDDEYEGVSPTPSVLSKSTTITGAANVEISLNLGSGDTAASGVKSVTYLNNSGAVKTMASGTDYSYADGVLTIKSSHVSSFYSGTATSRTYTVTFKDAANTTDTFTFTK